MAKPESSLVSASGMVPLLLLLLLRLTTCIMDTSSKSEIYDVVIIGAGMSGVSAARALAFANVTNFVVLEGRNYTGGRIHAVQFGNPSIHRGVIESGANWIHGSSDRNPLRRLAARARLATAPVPGSCANVSGYGLYHSDERQVTDAASRVARVQAAFACANRTAQQSEADTTAAKGLKMCGWDRNDAMDAAIEWEVTSANDMLSTSELSLQWMLPDPTYENFGTDDHFCHDQRPRGYAAVIDQVLQDAGSSTSGEKVKLNSNVTRIDAGGCGRTDGVTVHTADGRKFHGRFAISTLPLGVMQWSHSSIFSSTPLPAKQVDALSAFTMGNFTKIFAQWPKAFWSARGTQWLAGAGKDDPPGGPMEFHDLGGLVPGFNTLFTYVVGQDSVKWEAMTDAEAAAALTRRLQHLFPGVDVGLPSEFYMTRHGTDPLMRGAYSTARLGVTRAQFQDMVAPLVVPCPGKNTKRVFFAGEHTCLAYTGYAHGALESGIMAAGQVLDTMGKPQVLKTLCNDGRLHSLGTALVV